MTIRHLWPLALLVLPACGGGSGSQAALPASPSAEVEQTLQLDPDERGQILPFSAIDWESNPLPSYDAQTDTITLATKRSKLPADLPPGAIGVRIELSGAVLNRVTDDMMPADFAAYNDGTAAVRGVRGVKSGGAAYAIRRQDDGAYLLHERFGSTTLPTTGRGVFTGTYAGTLGAEINGDNRGTIKGLVMLEADFAGGTIEGVIDSRINQNSREFDPVVLLPSPMDQGQFSASTEGGNSPFLGHTTSVGGYRGAVVGANGNEIVGTVNISHLSSQRFENLLEAGAFVAERP